MIFILIGVTLFMITIYLLWNRRKKELKVAKMLEAKALSLRDVQKKIANDLAIEEGIEVKGNVKCKNALKAPFSLGKVVYYNCKVDRIYQKKEVFTGQDGQQHEKWESHTETIFNEENHTSFTINDGTGEVEIDLKGAEVTPYISYQSTEKVQLFSVSDRFDELPELKERFLRLRDEIGKSNEGKDVVGFEFIEYSLPVNKDLFVLGGVGVKKDLPLLLKKAGLPFVVSIRSAQQIYQNLDDKLQRYFLLAIVTGLAATVFIFYGIKSFL
jgi:hypothetical protein